MALKFFQKIFGSRNERMLKQYSKSVQAINALEAEMAALTDEQLQQKTPEFKAAISAGKHWMNCYQKFFLSFEKRVNVSLVCVIMMCK